MQQGARTDLTEISAMSQPEAAELLKVGSNQHVEISTPSQSQAAELLNVSREVASRLATLDRGNPNFGSANTEISAIAQPEAAELLNVSREYEGHDPIGFVLSLNLKRRHLDTAQRAMVASRLANLEHGQKKADVEISTTQTEAANLLNVSRESVVSARKVLDQGSEALIQKVDAGELSVSTAAKIAELPEEEQVEIVALQAEPLIAARAKERQSCGQGGVLLSANLPEAKPIDTRDELSTILVYKPRPVFSFNLSYHSLP